MSAESLCLRTFGEIVRPRVSKKMRKKEYLLASGEFEDDHVIAHRAAINGSAIGKFYSEILLEAILYFPRANEEDVPDITPAMCSQLKNGRIEAHEGVVRYAQQTNAVKIVGDFLNINLIPHIPKAVLSIVLDDVNRLVQGDTSLGAEKQRKLTACKKTKTPADYLAEVLVVAVCNGKNMKDIASISGISPDMSALHQAEELLATLPAPPMVSPPKTIAKYELKYIAELFAAYGDAEGIAILTKTRLRRIRVMPKICMIDGLTTLLRRLFAEALVSCRATCTKGSSTS